MEQENSGVQSGHLGKPILRRPWATETARESKRIALFVKRHWKDTLIVGGIGPLPVMLLGSLQYCSSMFGGGIPNIMAFSYLSEDADMLAVEEAYCTKKDELREYLDTY